MLYIFTGTNEYEVKLETQKWKKLFADKHGDFNLTHVKNLWEATFDFIVEVLTSNSLFVSKKLVIFDIDPTERKSVEWEKKLELLLSNVWNTTEDTIVLISYPRPDRRSKFYKDIIKIADKVQTYDEKVSHDLEQDIKKKYSSRISSGAISLLLRYKSYKQEKVIQEIEKLLITHSFIETHHIEEHILPELDESIFVLVDALLGKQKKVIFTTLSIISENTNIYLLYNSLLANIRTSFYIHLLKNKKISPHIIKTELWLWNRWFLVDKVYAMKHNEIKKLYTDLILLDRKMKTGKMMWSDDKDFLFEIEKIILKTF